MVPGRWRGDVGMDTRFRKVGGGGGGGGGPGNC